MKPTPLPNGEFLTCRGVHRAPRGWSFFLSDEVDEWGPLMLTAIDEGGQSRLYHRPGYVTHAMARSVTIIVWSMFTTGALVGVIAMLIWGSS